jgi:hypothetical protein
MTGRDQLLEEARTAYREKRWDQAYDAFRSARDSGELPADDLSALGRRGVVAGPGRGVD